MPNKNYNNNNPISANVPAHFKIAPKIPGSIAQRQQQEQLFSPVTWVKYDPVTNTFKTLENLPRREVYSKEYYLYNILRHIGNAPFYHSTPLSEYLKEYKAQLRTAIELGVILPEEGYKIDSNLPIFLQNLTKLAVPFFQDPEKRFNASYDIERMIDQEITKFGRAVLGWEVSKWSCITRQTDDPRYGLKPKF